MTTITKGTPVYVFSSYDDKGTVSVSHYTVGSWGKKQGHLINGNGVAAEHRVYVGHITHINGGHGVLVVAVADCPDVEAHALAVAEQFLAAYRTHFANCRAHYGPTASTGYLESLARSESQLHEPRILLNFR